MSHRLKRRDFIKYGLGGSTAILTGGLSSTLALTESHYNRNQHSHPWWVKEIDKPLLAIDDKVYKRFNPNANVFGSFQKYVGIEKFLELRRTRSEHILQYCKENRTGFRIEDRALSEASWTVSRTGGTNRGLRAHGTDYV